MDKAELCEQFKNIIDSMNLEEIEALINCVSILETRHTQSFSACPLLTS